ncbi:MAG: hypothetical protein HOH43_15630, partial [Candidatus Latescibacteria bacterium]|nr:hypothetical protein [Candidatus Latescibacterota bacterium]
FRQRKSLLLTSLLLFFVYYAHLSISTVTTQELVVEVAIPESLHFMLWVSWGYFFLRYLQYYLITARGGLDAVIQAERQLLAAAGPDEAGPGLFLRVVLFNTYLTDYLLPLAFGLFAAAFALIVR